MITLEDARRVISAAEKKAAEIAQPVNIAVVDLQTQDLAQYSQPNKPFFGIHTTNGGRIIIFPGGVPLQRDGEVVGAIGVSGGFNEQDQEVAEAGAKAF